ncbi:MAG: hypothetical protein ACP6IP_02775 [Candidatus Njordarchaeia archaeon]
MNYGLIVLFLVFFIVTTLVLALGYLSRRLKIGDIIGSFAVSIVFIIVYYIVLVLFSAITIAGLNSEALGYIIGLWASILASNQFWSEDIAKERKRVSMMFVSIIITIILYAFITAFLGSL